MTKKKLPDLNYLNSLFNLIEGELFWKVNRADNKIKIGDKAGNINKDSGYYQVGIDNIQYQSHCIIWKMYTGNDPVYEIDHLNHIRTDNSLSNLRDTNDNTKNRSKNKNNTSGHANIYIHKDDRKKKFMVVFRHENYTKSFLTLEEAIQHRNEKYIEFGFHENHGL